MKKIDKIVKEIREKTLPQKDMTEQEQAKRQFIVKRMFNNLYPDKQLRI